MGSEIDNVRKMMAADQDAGPRSGDFDRFMAKAERIPGLVTPRPKRVWLRFSAIAVAAAVAIFWMVGHNFGSVQDSESFFAGCVTDAEVYERYCHLVAKSVVQIAEQTALSDEIYEDVMSALDGITGESISMMEQLPEEMPEYERMESLKEYYAARLAAVQQLNDYKCIKINLL